MWVVSCSNPALDLHLALIKAEPGFRRSHVGGWWVDGWVVGCVLHLSDLILDSNLALIIGFRIEVGAYRLRSRVRGGSKVGRI